MTVEMAVLATNRRRSKLSFRTGWGFIGRMTGYSEVNLSEGKRALVGAGMRVSSSLNL